jgi:hypothetical protein
LVREGWIVPFPYAFPQDLMVSSVPAKRHVWADVIPGVRETYRFGPGQEQEYYQQYRDARFAFTRKKRGWDCLRHYEILASGCIPVFRDLDSCPSRTMVSFPKKLVAEANRALLPWKQSHDRLFDEYAHKLLTHAREHLSCVRLAQSFLTSMGVERPRPRVLVLRCHSSANYSRETLLIGLKQIAECVEYPRIPYLYDDFPIDSLGECHGLGYGYTRRLPATPHEWSDDQIRASIRAHEWDVVVYGKMGVGEREPGTVPDSPFWRTVSAAYARYEIAFLFGGDRTQRIENPFSRAGRHVLRHAALGRCFVRELV